MVVLFRTLSIPLVLTSQEQELLLRTMSEASNVYNLLAGLAVQNKTTSKVKLNELGYNTAREKHSTLPSAIVQATRDTVIENLKSMHSNFIRKNNEFRPSKRKGKKKYHQPWSVTPSKKTTSSLRLDRRTFTLRGNQLTLSTVEKRVKTIIKFPEWFSIAYEKYEPSRSATLSYNKQTKRFFLNLLFKTPEDFVLNKLTTRTETVGLDRGLYTLAYLSNGEKYSSKEVRRKRRAQRYNRAKLQQKGTQSAKRHLKALSGKEKRFMLDYNHQLSKKILANPQLGTLVLENLTGITEQRKGRTLNTLLHQWNFRQLEQLLRYKAETLGVAVVTVDPRYTSQACNQCGVVSKKNRTGNKYTCACGWSAHADLNAALNIRDLYTPGSQNSLTMQLKQAVVNQPNVGNYPVSTTSPEARPQSN